MGEEERSFGRLVFNRAWYATWRFFGSAPRDIALFIFSTVGGFSAYYLFNGLPAALDQAMSVVAFTVGPLGILWLLLFAWHMWLAPMGLAYEAAKARTISVRPARSERLTDKATIEMAGNVRWLAENARRGRADWPPVDDSEFHARARLLFGSSSAIWAMPQFNVLRENFSQTQIALPDARKGGNDAIVNGALGDLELGTNELCSRLIDG